MLSRLKMGATHFRVPGVAQLQAGTNTCPHHKATSHCAQEALELWREC